MAHDEDLLLALLNSAPVVDGEPTDTLAGDAGRDMVDRFDGTGSAAELDHLRRMRDVLHDVVRGDDGAVSRLDALLAGATRVPQTTATGIHWQLRAPADRLLAVRAAEAWSDVTGQLPGRLRPCANDECNLFLIDHSRPGTAKWCSMATCGNRMKVRAHSQRKRAAVSA